MYTVKYSSQREAPHNVHRVLTGQCLKVISVQFLYLFPSPPTHLFPTPPTTYGLILGIVAGGKLEYCCWPSCCLCRGTTSQHPSHFILEATTEELLSPEEQHELLLLTKRAFWFQIPHSPHHIVDSPDIAGTNWLASVAPFSRILALGWRANWDHIIWSLHSVPCQTMYVLYRAAVCWYVHWYTNWVGKTTSFNAAGHIHLRRWCHTVCLERYRWVWSRREWLQMANCMPRGKWGSKESCSHMLWTCRPPSAQYKLKLCWRGTRLNDVFCVEFH